MILYKYRTGSERTEQPTTEPTETTTTTAVTTITVTMNDEDFVGMNYSEAEKLMKDMGFTWIQFAVIETDDQELADGMVASVEIYEDIMDPGDFASGDSFISDAMVMIRFYECVEKVDSKFEKAFVRELGSYSLYFMFDTDDKTVVFFGTNDTYVEKGTYTGKFSTGVKIEWSHGESGQINSSIMARMQSKLIVMAMNGITQYVT